jgi:tRNA threonylcarbamoyl adenosine modification protein (Sua5/YciO/YrdC/YwlC family)
MKIIGIDPQNPQPDLIRQAADFARTGAPFVLPTDTVYGIGLAVLPDSTPDGIYAIKKRDADKAIPWLVAGVSDLDVYGRQVPDYALRLAHEYWPGALTLIVWASDKVPVAFRAAGGSIALRAPESPVVLALIRELSLPLATSSANMQGEPPAISLDDLDNEVATQITLAIDSGPCPQAAPSTIISCLGEEPIIIRQGPLKPVIALPYFE